MSPRRSPQPTPQDAPGGLERLQKVLAAAGIGSRRECEELITTGRVEVDGEFATELGCKVDPATQKIMVDGVALKPPKRVYFALNKPVGVVSTNSDPDGRPRVIDLIKSPERLYPVGRLDRTSEGLILVTNDGELANRLTHPRYGVEKIYRVRVVGKPMPEDLAKLRKGIYLSEGLARLTSIKIKQRFKQSTELEIVLQEGLNREIRRMLARIGHKVVQLKRVAIGPIRLGTMPVGAHRALSREEVQALRRATKRRREPADKPASTAKSRETRSAAASGTTASSGGGEAAPARPRRRKTGSSALAGYARPGKQGAKPTSPAKGRSGGGKQEPAGAAKPEGRPKKKKAAAGKQPAKPGAKKKKPLAKKNKTKKNKKAKKAGKTSAGKKKTGGKRPR